MKERKGVVFDSGFMKLSDVLKVIPISKSTWYRLSQAGIFPKPFKLGRTALYRVKDIENIISRIENGSIEGA